MKSFCSHYRWEQKRADHIDRAAQCGLYGALAHRLEEFVRLATTTALFLSLAALATPSDTDYSGVLSLVPEERYGRGDHRLSLGNCSVYRWEGSEITFRLSKPDGSRLKSITVKLPRDLDRVTQWNGESIPNKANIMKVDGGTRLDFEVTQRWFDTGGYYTREVASVSISDEGTLRKAWVVSYRSTRPYDPETRMRGPYAPFVIEDEIQCDG